jgi:hypothetical protein
MLEIIYGYITDVNNQKRLFCEIGVREVYHHYPELGNGDSYLYDCYLNDCLYNIFGDIFNPEKVVLNDPKEFNPDNFNPRVLDHSKLPTIYDEDVRKIITDYSYIY